MGHRYQYFYIIMDGHLTNDQIKQEFEKSFKITIENYVQRYGHVNKEVDLDKYLQKWEIALTYPDIFGLNINRVSFGQYQRTFIIGATFEWDDRFLFNLPFPEAKHLSIPIITKFDDISKYFGFFYCFLTSVSDDHHTHNQSLVKDKLVDLKARIIEEIDRPGFTSHAVEEIQQLNTNFERLKTKIGKQLPTPREVALYNDFFALAIRWQTLSVALRKNQSADALKVLQAKYNEFQEKLQPHLDTTSIYIPDFHEVINFPSFSCFQFIVELRSLLETKLDMNYSLAELEFLQQMVTSFNPVSFTDEPNQDIAPYLGEPKMHKDMDILNQWTREALYSQAVAIQAYEKQFPTPVKESVETLFSKFSTLNKRPLEIAMLDANKSTMIQVLSDCIKEISFYYKNFLEFLHSSLEEVLPSEDDQQVNFGWKRFYKLRDKNQLTGEIYYLFEHWGGTDFDRVDLAPLLNLTPKILRNFDEKGIFLVAGRNEDSIRSITHSSYDKPYYWYMFSSLHRYWKLDVLKKLYPKYRAKHDVSYKDQLLRLEGLDVSKILKEKPIKEYVDRHNIYFKQQKKIRGLAGNLYNWNIFKQETPLLLVAILMGIMGLSLMYLFIRPAILIHDVVEWLLAGIILGIILIFSPIPSNLGYFVRSFVIPTPPKPSEYDNHSSKYLILYPSFFIPIVLYLAFHVDIFINPTIVTASILLYIALFVSAFLTSVFFPKIKWLGHSSLLLQHYQTKIEKQGRNISQGIRQSN